MAFLSELVGKPVYDSRQTKVGVIEDLCVPAHQLPYPQVSAIKIGERWVPWGQVETLDDTAKLRVSSTEIRDYVLKQHDVRLRDEVLDHQVVDVEDRKLRRVNDLAFTATNGRYALAGVDISSRALLRRLGL